MKRNVTIILYILLLAGVIGFGLKFGAGFHKSVEVQSSESSGTNQAPSGAAHSVADAPASRGISGMMTYAILGFFCLLGLALLAARDITHFLAHRMERFVFDEDLAGERNPEYEEAEKAWANGQHLEAVQLMRDYLKEHPREQYVAL